MMTIRRSCSYRIITRAVNAEGQPLVGLLTPGAEDCELCLDADQLQAAVKTRADTVIVYNQHADALALVDTLNLPESQVFIEIRQDTKGVLGLHAVRRSKPDNETLELIYQ
jgi:hypothetical protein